MTHKRLIVQIVLIAKEDPEHPYMDRKARGLMEIISADIFKEVPHVEKDPIFPPVTVTVLDMNDMKFIDYAVIAEQYDTIKKGAKMKLPLTIATALAALMYVIVTTLIPDFPITSDQFLQLLILLLGALGVVVTEEQVRAYLVRKGYKQFQRNYRDEAH